MAKKLIVVALAVVTVSLVLNKTRLGENVKVWWHDNVGCMASKSKPVSEEVALKEELEDLNKEVAKLEDDDVKLVNLIAKEDVAIRKAEALLEALKNERDQEQAVAFKLQKELQTVQKKDSANAEEMIIQAVKNLKLKDRAVATQEQNVKVCNENAKALRQQRETLFLTRQELRNKLAELEVRVVKIQIEQAKTLDPTDKSRVADIRRRIDAVDTRVEVREREREVRSELPQTEKRPVQVSAPKKDDVQDALNYLNDKNQK